MNDTSAAPKASPSVASPPASSLPASSLPAWDLSDLYAAPDSPEVTADLARAEQMAKSFARAHAGTLASVSGAALAAVIAEYERILL